MSGAPERRGERVFMRACNGCHPRGEAGPGPALNDKPAPPFLIRARVRLGLGAMPGFPEHTLSRSEVLDLVAYMLAVRKAPRTRAER